MRHLTVRGRTFYTNYFRDVAGHGGACTVTANQRRHDLSAAFTRTNLRLPRLKKESRLKHFANTYRVWWVEAGRWPIEADCGEMFPLHSGDAKHPAGFAA